MQNEAGKITIADNVFLALATKAAIKVEGVTKFGSTILESVTSFITRKNHVGISVEAGEIEVAFDIKLVVDYGYKIPDVALAVQQAVISEVESYTGYRVVEVVVTFVDVNFPPAPEATQLSTNGLR